MLVDEINRAMPKTQSSLLEAMAETQVTVDGVTRDSQAFLVLATQNPIELEGTFPLPEAQLDRFFLKTALGYPESGRSCRSSATSDMGIRSGDLGPVVSLADVEELHHASEEVYVDELIQRWVIDVVRATRELDTVAIGASVRGSLALERAARAWALLHDRDYVIPEDVEELFLPVLGHRILFTPTFLVEIRKHGRKQAAARFVEQCFEARGRRPLSGEVAPIAGEQGD